MIQISGRYSPWDTKRIYQFLFNTSLSELLFIIDNIDFANYAHDNTIYWGADSVADIVLSLQSSDKKIFDWFLDN